MDKQRSSSKKYLMLLGRRIEKINELNAFLTLVKLASI